MTNDVRHAPDHFVRKLWRLGFQASLDEVVTCGAALQFVLAERQNRGAAFVIGSQALVGHADGPWPGSGAVLAAVEEACGRRADRTVGKPEPDMYATVRDRLGTGRYLAVGDRLDVDVAGARRSGIDSALVLTGSTAPAEAEAADPRPTHVADSLAAPVLV